MTSLSMRGRKPLYEEVAESLVGDIRSGILSPGSRLPTELELQKKFGVSRITIRQAVGILVKNNLITRFRRRGSFINENPNLPNTNNTDNTDSLRVVQFLHIGLPKPEPMQFSRGEVEAAERYFATNGFIMAWSKLSSSEVISGSLPRAIQSGQCAGMLVDGVVLDPHLEALSKAGCPIVVLGNHDIQFPVPEVRFAARKIADQIARTLQSLNVPDLVILENPEANSLQRCIQRRLPSALARHSLAPVRILPQESAGLPDFISQLDRIAPRCAIMVLEAFLTSVWDNMCPSGNREHPHFLLSVGFPSPANAPLKPHLVRIVLDPAELAQSGAKLLQNIIHNHGRASDVANPHYLDAKVVLGSALSNA